MVSRDIAALRRALGFSQTQLAQLLGVHPLTISKWERGVLCPSDHQAALLKSFAKARRANRQVGSEAADALVAAGVIVALFLLLRAAVGDAD
jgi:transcriptional regulator with XRE-family HTH domain